MRIKKDWLLIIIVLVISVVLTADSLIWIFSSGFSKIQSIALLIEEQKDDNSFSNPFIHNIFREPLPEKIITVANPRKNLTDFQAGVAVLTYGNDSRFDTKVQRTLNRLVTIGANSVSLGFPIFQENWTSSELWVDEDITLSENNIRTFIRKAHERELTVMIRPLLDEKTLYQDGQWRGSIQPKDIDAWFESYSNILLEYARICEEEKVDILNIGAELSSLEPETEKWLNLIKEVRSIFSGQLTYSANWHNVFDEDVQFWSELDFISIDAFFPLNVSEEATKEELFFAWQPWIEKTKELKGQYNIPIVFTEVGTVSQAGSYREPWRWEHNTDIDLNAQYIYYLATCQALDEIVDGIYWWYAGLDFPQDPEMDIGFSPFGKPAEKAIMQCFEKIEEGKTEKEKR